MESRRSGAEHRQVVDGRTPAELQRAFHLFGRVEAPQVASPIYAELSYGVSTDPDLIALAAETQPGQPPPNMLFAAVQYLLMRGVEHPLSAHYPAVTSSDRPFAPAFPLFRDFCLSHSDQIVPLLQERRTQTNVIQRCICLLPAFALVHMETAAPLHLLEVGPSAGLNLNWDQYRYTYPSATPEGSPIEWGPPGSLVHLSTRRLGTAPLPALPSSIPVASRLGIDVRPIDPSDDDAILWLRALIFPEPNATSVCSRLYRSPAPTRRRSARVTLSTMCPEP